MIIVAPSGSGKSHLARVHPIFKDGDEVIRDTVGWPTEEEWWLAPDRNEYRNEQWGAIVEWAKNNPSRVVLFNIDIPYKPKDVPVLIMIPSRSIILKRLFKHQWSEKMGMDEQKRMEQTDRGIANLKASAAELDIPLIDERASTGFFNQGE